MADIDNTKMRQLDFTLLLVMQSLLHHRRTTAAAAELGLSQSAISHALARLRVLFSDPLFLRRPHGLEPTRHALEIGPRIEKVLREAREAMGLVDLFDPLTTTRGFRIAAPDFLGTLLAAPLLRTFEREAPKARFALRIQLGQDALSSLDRDEIDIALGRFPAPSDGFAVTPLYNDRYCLIGRANHPELKAKVTKALFERLDHVAVSVGGDFRAYTDDDFRDLGLKRNIVATVPRFTVAFDVVSHTNAVAIAPSRLAYAYAKAFKFQAHDLPVALSPVRVVAVRRANPDPGLDWLIDRLTALLPKDA
jgi:DNA-binding transcriptional LysR family regulator